jgi:hypothetical protein
MSARVEAGDCPKCGKRRELLAPLHGERGGPMWCIHCGMDWHGKHGRIRKLGRIVIKAMALYERAGGKLYGQNGVDKLRLAASGYSVGSLDGIDNVGADVGDITSELLRDTLQLVHPDHHPPERKELARRVTQELVALKPFVFPAPKPDPDPDPVATPQARDASDKSLSDNLKDMLREEYPCADCEDETPYHYCDPCKAEWEKRNKAECERERAKQREWYERRKEMRELLKPDLTCICGRKFKPKRADGKLCSAACRQRAYRQRMAGIDVHPSRQYLDAAKERKHKRERNARMKIKWKEFDGLKKGAVIIMNGADHYKFSRGTEFTLIRDETRYWHTNILAEDSKGNWHTFRRQDVDKYDIAPAGAASNNSRDDLSNKGERTT